MAIAIQLLSYDIKTNLPTILLLFTNGQATHAANYTPLSSFYGGDPDLMQLSMSNHVCMILCSSDRLSIDEAQAALEQDGLTVERDNDKLICFWGDSPKFTIDFQQGEEVRAEAKTMGEEYPNYRSKLKNCDARFEISFADLSEVLNEINTLIEIQLTLQDATEGIVFTSWNGILEI